MLSLNQQFLKNECIKYNNLDSKDKIYNPFNKRNDNDINKKNLLRLFIGMIPSNLPKDLFFPGLEELLLDLSNNKHIEKSKTSLITIENDLYCAFSNFVKVFNLNNVKRKRKQDKKRIKRFGRKSQLVTLFGKYRTPSYIYKRGVEPIKYNSIKNRHQIMLMGIDNPLLYLIFIYNTFIALNPLFYKLYSVQNKKKAMNHIDKVVSYSESPILLNDKLINVEYYYPNTEYSHLNRKIEGQSSVERGAIHKFELENEHPYYMKLNLQSFYPNIYTHNLDRISKHDLFRIIENHSTNKDIIEDYLTFLDRYNMKNNEERTKGIIIGPLSSRISSELLSLDIFYQAEYGGDSHEQIPMRLIDKKLSGILQNPEVEYARYVDTVIVFADNRSVLKQLQFKLGRFLQQYELKFQESKCKILKGIYMPKMANFSSIKENIPFISNSNNPHISFYGFIYFRNYVKHLIDIKDFSTLKAVIDEFFGNWIIFRKGLSKLFISFLLKTSIICPCVSYNVYNLIAQTIIRNIKTHTYDSTIYKQLKQTLSIINNRYDGTTLQIWTYYLLNLICDKYNDKTCKNKLYNSMRVDIDLYPLIVMTFISRHNSKEFNNKILTDIFKEYIRDENSMVSADKIKQLSDIYETIMFSKWAFPIYKLHVLCNMSDNSESTSNYSISRIFFGKNKSKNSYKVFRLFDIVLDSIKGDLNANNPIGE